MRAIAVLFVLSSVACTNAELFRSAGQADGPLDNKLSVQSSFCTLDPNELKFPVKIMFVADTSQSMAVTDPAGQRITAVQNVIQAYLPDPGVEFAILTFNGNSNVLTKNAMGQDGFSRDMTILDNAIVQMGMAGGNTNYEGALNDVFRVLASDMQHLSDTAANDLARAKYVIVFFSDGFPYPVDPPRNTRDSILQHVSDIENLQRIFQPKEIRLHTALLLAPMGGAGGFRCTDSDLQGGDPTCPLAKDAMSCQMLNNCVWIGANDEAQSLLEAMSMVGNGTFRSFANGEMINFLKIDFTTIRRIFTLKNLIITNLNARPKLLFTGPADKIGTAPPDSDGDGLDDETEQKLGTNPLAIDTDGDGFNDLLEVRLSASGFDPLDPSDADCRLAIDRVDTDGDGLLDCEERFVGTNRHFFDTDADGMPDDNELVFNTNPTGNDALDDLDFDSARNGDEVRGHTDPRVNDAAVRSSIAYRYDVKNKGLQSDGRSCYDFRVDNITLAATLGKGENHVMIYLDEAPFDDPTDHGTFRVACVKQIYAYPDFRDPPYPAVEIPATSFKDPTMFNPTTDCVAGTPPKTNIDGVEQ
jgi:hypothetical protein